MQDSHRDEITGLNDMKGFCQKSEEVMNRMGQDAVQCAVFFLDINNFKVFNADHGRRQGDELLRYTARCLKKVFPGRICGRFGDDHFTVLCYQDEAEKRVRVMQSLMSRFPGDATVSVRAGVCSVQRGEDPMYACDRARIASESIRGSYTRRLCLFSKEMEKSIMDRKYILDHVQEAVDEEWIQVYYQPVIRTESGKLCSLEALTRWQDPQYGLLQPGQFIEILEDAQLIHLVDLFAAEKSCALIRKRLDAGLPVVPVSVNLSRVDFHVTDICHEIEKLTEKYDLPHELLEIEITERAMSGDDGTLRKSMEWFRSHGYEVWMDDFGSEYSSLNALKEYDFDVIKIDMKFLRVNESSQLEKTKIILRSAVNMARQMGIHTLCEGVETEEALQYLKFIGCEKVQGYYYSRPLPFVKIEKLGYDWEDRAERLYMDTVGLTDLYYEGTMNSYAGLAIWEVREDSFQLLSASPGFYRLLPDAGLSEGTLEELLSSQNERISSRLKGAAEEAMKENHEVSLDLVLNGSHMSIRMRLIARNEENGRYAMLVRVQNLSKLSGFENMNLRENALRSLCSVFERLDLIIPEDDWIQTIYRSSSSFADNYNGPDMKDTLREYARNHIAEPEQERFLSFYDIDTLMERLKRSDAPYQVSLFHGPDGELKVYMLTGTWLNEKQMFLSGMAETDDTLKNAIFSQPEKTVENSRKTGVDLHKVPPLFQSFMDMAEIGIFWKDRSRRFMGANSYFRRYYNLSNDAEFIGLTDEEMGWHVNPDPFMEDEYRVIHEGLHIRGALGRSITHGQNRTIRVWKSPVVINGRTEGLIGYFMDVTDWQLRMPRNSGKYQAREMHADLEQYDLSWKERGSDFAVVEILAEKRSDMKEVLDLADRAAGHDSVAGQVDGERVVILHQFEDENEVRSLLNRISAMETAETKAGKQMNLAIRDMIWSKMGEDKRRTLLEAGRNPDLI